MNYKTEPVYAASAPPNCSDQSHCVRHFGRHFELGRMWTKATRRWRRPPEASRFKKGQSGNPLGRPKARRNVRSEIEDALTESVPVNLQGTQQCRGLVTAIFLKQCEKALNGDHRSAEAVLKRAKEFGVLQKGPSYEELLATILDPDDDD